MPISKDAVILRVQMLVHALHISAFKIRIVWTRTAVIAKFPNRPFSRPLRNQSLICTIQEKDLSANVLSSGMTHYLKFLGIWVNFSDNQSFCCRLQSDLYLINLPCWWHNMITFLFQTLFFYQNEVSFQHSVSLHAGFLAYFWRTNIPMYVLSAWLWPFFQHQTSQRSYYLWGIWKRSWAFSRVFLWMWIISSTFLDPKLPCRQLTNDRNGSSSCFAQIN